MARFVVKTRIALFVVSGVIVASAAGALALAYLQGRRIERLAASKIDEAEADFYARSAENARHLADELEKTGARHEIAPEQIAAMVGPVRRFEKYQLEMAGRFRGHASHPESAPPPGPGRRWRPEPALPAAPPDVTAPAEGPANASGASGPSAPECEWMTESWENMSRWCGDERNLVMRNFEETNGGAPWQNTARAFEHGERVHEIRRKLIQYQDTVDNSIDLWAAERIRRGQ